MVYIDTNWMARLTPRQVRQIVEAARAYVLEAAASGELAGDELMDNVSLLAAYEGFTGRQIWCRDVEKRPDWRSA